VIVLLSDGDANADNSSHPDNMLAAEIANQCQQAVTAAQNAAKAGTWVYSIAFNSPTSGCSTDSGTYPGGLTKTACHTMAQIANIPGTSVNTYVNDPTKFYSDNAQGCQSTRNPSITAINSIFQSIGYSLSTGRLLPSACFAASPPSWC